MQRENPLCETAGCGRPVRYPSDVVCSGCLAALLANLRALGDMWDDLEDSAVRGTSCGGGGPRTHRSSSRERPLPFDESAARLRDESARALVAWAFEVQQEFPHRRWPDPRAAETIAWLASLRQLLAEFSRADEFATVAADLVGRVRAAVGRRARDRVLLGTCECGAAVYGNPQARLAYCTPCGRPYDVAGTLADRREFASRVTGTAAELLENWRAWSAKPVSRATLFRLLATLEPVNPGSTGPRRYRVLDVATARSNRVIVAEIQAVI
ncbi:hypothetical protein ACFORO_25820 [Amycolatopsis halotolerans]|uniref:Zinc ribbon domain-containing protein n=1 Tax=Amycolatopsis halotolerans TaxID=330083 RepID=A0ABV7QMZ9_9PSEU